MRTMIWIFMLAASVALAATNEVPTMAEQEQMFMEAVMLKQQGFYGEAEVRLKKLAELQPDQPTVKQMLAEVREKLKRREPDAATLLKRKLSAIIVPDITFREAAVGDAIRFLGDECRRLSPDKSGVNLVWMAPEEMKSTKVTLQLRDIPMLDALQYVTDVAKLKYRIDPHAVVIYKPEPPAPVVPADANAKPE